MKPDFLRSFEFFTGVPDSLLAPLCTWLMQEYGLGKDHIIAANEGNCVALAAGYHLATGKVPVVYMQNSGIGNIVNPVASLLNGKVYGIPCLFVVGWRGEPGVHDEPQHIFQGEVTVRLLEDMDIRTFVIGKETTEDEVYARLEEWKPLFASGGQAAFVVRKGALTCDGKPDYRSGYTLRREEVIRRISAAAGDDPIVCTTGKASRELFEIREARGEGHGHDFLTVGSMGHSSSIALEIALRMPERRVWCIDGDGAMLMHMGAMALIGTEKPRNFVHVIINNGAHETVGGMPTVASGLDIGMIARGCGYPRTLCVEREDELDAALAEVRQSGELILLEVRCALGARADLGRPTTTARENKQAFMRGLQR